MKKAYTLLELIIVIVVIGITGTFSTKILGDVFENYALQKEVSAIQMSSGSVLNQIENYIRRSVPYSVVRKNGLNYEAINSVGNGDLTDVNQKILWLDIDKESIDGIWDGVSYNLPIYNMWINVQSSNNLTIDFSANSQLLALEALEGDISNTAASPALYFIYGNEDGTPFNRFWNVAGTSSMFKIVTPIVSNTSVTLTTAPAEIGEIAYISHTGMGLQLTGSDLELIHNFQPWDGETELAGTVTTLLNNVSSFEFWNEGSMFRIKICIESNYRLTADENLEICKERAIAL